MAIEVNGEARIGKLIAPMLLLIFSLLISAALAASYFYIISSTSEANAVYTEKSKALEPTSEEKTLEEKISLTSGKIAKFASLLETHNKVINSLKFLEDKCHPDVWFSAFSYKADTGEMTLSGFAKDMKVVSQQLMLLKDKNEFLSKIALASLTAPDKDGMVGFALNLTLVPEILKK